MIEGSQSEYARKVMEKLEMGEDCFYNPLLDRHTLDDIDKKFPSGEDDTTYAAEVLAQIPGVEVGEQEGHDIYIRYKGRTKKLMGGSGQTGKTSPNALKEVVKELIVDQDVVCGHIKDSEREKRRDIIYDHIFEH